MWVLWAKDGAGQGAGMAAMLFQRAGGMIHSGNPHLVAWIGALVP